MSQLSRGIFAAIAVSLTLGAVAWGRDLSAGRQDPAGTPEATVNRAAKTDRSAGVAGSGTQTRTISLRLDALADTSVVIRIPVAQARNNSSVPSSFAPSLKKSGDRKMTVACEPVVSVLTEVAKLLQPGRCVT